MNTKEVLIAARQKIERPECWTQRVWARDKWGKQTFSASQSAVCWCALGAINSVGGDDRAIEALYPCLPEEHAVASFNDDPATTHADVLALFDRAIEACEP